MDEEQKILAYELHKPKRVKFPTRRVITDGIDYLWQADLVDMQELSKWNRGYNYILTVLDTFSKVGFARAVKSKNAKDVTVAFEDIILTSTQTPIHLQTDAGKEFFNSQFRALMKKYGINHYHTHSEKKASVVERWNRTIKGKMWRQFTELNTLKWIDLLLPLVDAYNNSVHRTIGMKPKNVNKRNENLIHHRLIMRSNSRSKRGKSKPSFKIGDVVRITKKKNVFAKGYRINWSEELFRVAKVLPTRPPTYQLEDMSGEEITGSFYEPEMQKTAIPSYARIEKVLSRKKDKHGNVLIHVKWKSYDDKKFNQWIALSKTKKL